jgi:hypothetical protein
MSPKVIGIFVSLFALIQGSDLFASDQHLILTAKMGQVTLESIDRIGPQSPPCNQRIEQVKRSSLIVDPSQCMKDICGTDPTAIELKERLLKAPLPKDDEKWLEQIYKTLDGLRPNLENFYQAAVQRMINALPPSYQAKVKPTLDASLLKDHDLDWKRSKNEFIANLSELLKLLPTDTEIDVVNKEYGLRRDAIRNRFLANLSGAEKERFEKCFNDYATLEPLNGKEWLKGRILSDLKSVASGSKDSVFFHVDELLTETNPTADSPSLNPFEPIASLFSGRYHYLENALRDHNEVADGPRRIVLSWGTAKQMDTVGVRIIDHELGHVLSSCLPQSKDITCLHSLHQSENLPGPQQYQFIEEDFADEIAAANKGPNPACYWSFPDKSANFLNLDGMHSPSFFRMLHIELLMRQKVPDSCKTFSGDLSVNACVIEK